MSGRCIGLDVHRDFCEVAIWEAGKLRSAGRIEPAPRRWPPSRRRCGQTTRWCSRRPRERGGPLRSCDRTSTGS